MMRLWSIIKRRLPAKTNKDDSKTKSAHIPTALKWVIASLSIGAILVWAAVFTAPSGGKLQVSITDVGQGDSILIKSPSNQYILVDGGPNPDTICLEVGEALPFWEHSINMVILTHPHDDHVSGLVEITRRYNVNEVLSPPDSFLKAENASASPAYEEFRKIIADKNIECTAAQEGQIIDIGGANIEVLNPPDKPYEDTDSDIDNNGVVLRVSMDNISFLFSADLYWDGELHLVCNHPILQSTVLKVSHHGSKSSTRSYFLNAVDPQVAVISVGAGNRFGHPSEETVERLNTYVGEDMVFTTMNRGTITFTTDGERLWVDTER
jgi:competence protein ComEC